MGKNVTMPQREAKQPQQEKLTYEQLEQVAREASQQANMFLEELKKMNNEHMFRRLDYLFAIIANGDKFPEEFVKTSVEEVIGIMTVKQKAE